MTLSERQVMLLASTTLQGEKMLQAKVFEAHSRADLENQLHFWWLEEERKSSQTIKIIGLAQSEQTIKGPMGLRITLTIIYEDSLKANL